MNATARDERAIVHPVAGRQHFDVGWVAPHADLVPVVGHHWIVRWQVDEPYEQQVISHPVVHVVVERHEAPAGPRLIVEVHGVVRGTFVRRLTGAGRAHGVRFRAGTFRQLLGADVSSITDRVLPAEEVLGAAWSDVARAAIARDDDAEAARMLDGELRARLGRPDPVGVEVADLVDRIVGDRSLTRAEEAASLAGVSLRTLQRTFTRHVGVPPKWVVRTARLHDLAGRLAAGLPVDLADLAAELGYSDQSHLSRDLKRAVGSSPADYLRAQASARGAPSSG